MRGSVARSQMKTKRKNATFKTNQMNGQPCQPSSPPSVHPPKKSVASDRAGGDHVDVLGHLEEAPAQPAELGQVAGDQFLLGLGQIEGRAVDLGDSGDAVEQEGQRLRQHEPDALIDLRLDDADHAQRPGEHQHTAERQADADLIRDHLRRRAQRAEQRVVVARRPARKHDAIDRQR